MTQLERQWHWRRLIEKDEILAFFTEYRQSCSDSGMYEWICEHLDKEVFHSEYAYYYNHVAYEIERVPLPESNLRLLK